MRLSVMPGTLFATALLFSGTTWAQGFPVKPVRLIVPFAAGGPGDSVARFIAPGLSEIWGHQVVIDNRGGANSIVGSEVAARAAPDGYTLVLPSAGFTINVTLYPKLPFDAIRDFTPVSTVTFGPSMLVTHPSLPVRNLKDLVALAKAKPRTLTYGSSGSGAPSSHLGMELLKVTAGVDIIHVPYKSMPGYEANNWYALFAPAGLPTPIADKIYGDVTKLLQSPELRDRFAAAGMEARSMPPVEFAAFVKREIAKWGKVVKASGAKAE